jgi:hypothetical protein
VWFPLVWCPKRVPSKKRVWHWDVPSYRKTRWLLGKQSSNYYLPRHLVANTNPIQNYYTIYYQMIGYFMMQSRISTIYPKLGCFWISLSEMKSESQQHQQDISDLAQHQADLVLHFLANSAHPGERQIEWHLKQYCPCRTNRGSGFVYYGYLTVRWKITMLLIGKPSINKWAMATMAMLVITRG